MPTRKYQQLQSVTIIFISDSVNSEVATLTIIAPPLTVICITHNYSVPASQKTFGVSVVKK